ncbi:DoxX family protein [Vibrio vulnificus]|nr:DoxX family protein [Vibrio vulnificus]
MTSILTLHGYGKINGIEGTSGFFYSVAFEPTLPLSYLAAYGELIGGSALALVNSLCLYISIRKSRLFYNLGDVDCPILIALNSLLIAMLTSSVCLLNCCLLLTSNDISFSSRIL